MTAADDHHQLRARLVAAFPALVRNPVFLGAGDFSIAFADGGRVVRVARHSIAADSLRREACTMPALARSLPVAVPCPRFHPWPQNGQYGIAIHDRIDGFALSPAAWEALGTAEQHLVAAQLAGLLRALHSSDTTAARACGIASVPHRQLAEDARMALQTGLANVPADARHRLQQLIAVYASSTAEFTPCLIHGDLSPDHVLYDPRSAALAGVIDFGDLAIGDPARDFIYIYGPELLSLVLEAYAPAQPERFRQRIGALYLIDQVLWTLAAERAGSADDAVEGSRQLVAACATFL